MSHARRRRLNRGVAIVGTGMSRFAPAGAEVTTRDLFAQAFQEMLESVENGLDIRDIEALFLGNGSSDLFENQIHVAPLIASWVGLVPIPALRIEDACASSGVAFREAVLGVASGVYDIVVAGGVEKMTNLATPKVTEVLARALDAVTEFSAGFTFPGVYAAMCTAHMAKWGTSGEDLMSVAIKNHANAALNPKAHFNLTLMGFARKRQEKARIEGKPSPVWRNEMDFLGDPAQNPVIAWPLRLFDCSTICDGASCILIAAEDIAKNFTANPLYVIGTGQASDSPLHERSDLASIPATREAARQAYEMAGIGARDIKLAEVHDCFTIAEIMAVEDLGFFKPGEAAQAIREGVIGRDGMLPVNTSGGLKAKGHPIGATGTAQLVELWEQMQGKAGQRQVTGRGLDLGLAHNVGAHGCSAVVHILERR